MRTLELTRAQARRGLTRLQFGEKTGVLETVRRLHSVQYDPLNVVGRNPDLVLQSRVCGYTPEKLYQELYQKHRAGVSGESGRRADGSASVGGNPRPRAAVLGRRGI